MNYNFKWQLRSKTSEYKRHLNYAIENIHNAISKAKFVISWSTGKDSTAMTHLINSLYPNIPIMIQFDDCDWPTKEEYAKTIIGKYGWNVEFVEPNFSVWNYACKFKIGSDELCSQSHLMTIETFLKLLDQKRVELHCDGVFIGLRSEESKARYMNLAKRGELYQLKDMTWRCCPLGRWTSEDVFAYLIDNDIPINPCYFNNRFYRPEDIRISWALPTPSGIRYGDMQHIRYYYPEQYQKLRKLGVV